MIAIETYYTRGNYCDEYIYIYSYTKDTSGMSLYM